MLTSSAPCILVVFGVCSLNACNQSEPCENGKYLANEKDCQKYFVCANHVWLEQSCGALYYDAVTCTCNNRESARCLTCPTTTTTTILTITSASSSATSSSTPNVTFVPTTASTTTTTLSTPTTMSTTESTPDCLNGCGVDFSKACSVTDGEYSASTADCTKYYRCVHNSWTENSCSSGLKYNPEICACDHDSPSCNYICPSTISSVKDSPTTTSTESMPPGMIFYGSNSNSTFYS